MLWFFYSVLLFFRSFLGGEGGRERQKARYSFFIFICFYEQKGFKLFRLLKQQQQQKKEKYKKRIKRKNKESQNKKKKNKNMEGDKKRQIEKMVSELHTSLCNMQEQLDRAFDNMGHILQLIQSSGILLSFLFFFFSFFFYFLCSL